ncbi:hypothetical protein ONE63_002958 [Megalurothrips usitatus]|uniref:DNA-directed primase/polymerase protein n=1 Tax=Megalurothrips usitatus TaxID=439358 RepID=A0AAV7X9S6_9NEOP|nr:hypothetical protein ONE63_002958 [Megalurothrips usitatus]
MSSPKSPAIAPSVFYKSPPAAARPAPAGPGRSRAPLDVELPRWLRSLDGPTSRWKVFKKQSDALQFSKDHGEGLMTFAFQEWDGTRRFLSAHPALFWFHDSNHKRPEERRTYEVITEGAVCKLYFDLEFEKEFNGDNDGVAMTNTFIKIVSYFLREEFGIACDRRCVLDLDSTTESKFSRHLLFQLPKTYFRDNYNAGSFVKLVCDKIRMIVHSSTALGELCEKSGVSEADVRNLFVSDKHGVSKIFCDEAVYTKNRHFRVYKSTKWNKNSPLILSLENEYKPVLKGNEELPEMQLFLDSLITYVDITSTEINILEHGSRDQKTYVVKTHLELPECPVVSEEGVISPQPVLDRFILGVVSPGSIRRSTYSPSLNRIVYEISGNRFCHNIGRPHKSNNVYYVVDMKSFVYYQKCHDSDCAGYYSKEKQLPPEIVFFLENEGDAAFESMLHLSDEELQDIWQAVSSAAMESDDTEMGDGSADFPEFGMSDSELLNSSNFMEENCL